MLELVAAGMPTRRIAEILTVSEQCVTYHIGNLLAKFQTENRAGLVGRAFVFGYLSASDWPPRARGVTVPRWTSPDRQDERRPIRRSLV